MPAPVIFPLDCFIGLAIGDVEVEVAGYARQPCALAYTTDTVIWLNTTTLQWRYAKQRWGSIDTVQIWDSLTDGSEIAALPLHYSVLIDRYDGARIPMGGLAVRNVQLPRPYGRLAFGTGPYATAGWVVQGATAVPRPYSEGPYGSDVYGGYSSGVILELLWSPVAACGSGTWATVDTCSLAA